MKKNNSKMDSKISRRDFIGAAAAAGAFTVVPRYVLGGPGYTPPSEKLNIAGVGVGGQGGGDINAVSGENNIVALCDVDSRKAARTFRRHPQAKKYTDFRVMLEKQKDIDAVIVATPDHNHAIISITAMKMGKHVYCEKPLTHSNFFGSLRQDYFETLATSDEIACAFVPNPLPVIYILRNLLYEVTNFTL